MQRKIIIIFTFISCFYYAQVSVAQSEIALETDDDKYSYAIGTKIGEQLLQQFGNQQGTEIDKLLAGIDAIISSGTPLLSSSESTAIIQQRQQEQLAAAAELAEQKIALGQAYLEENKSKDGVVVTDSGLQYSVLVAGDSGGTSPGTLDTVVVHYEGTLTDGTVFDSSYARGEPASFGLASIIPGWQEVLQLMKPGDKWSIVLPSEIAYGERGAGQSIGPNEVLLFDIELLEVKQSAN